VYEVQLITQEVAELGIYIGKCPGCVGVSWKLKGCKVEVNQAIAVLLINPSAWSDEHCSS
jgi:hypothetical protein